MRFHRYRAVVLAAAVVSVATALTPAHATADVRAFAVDGRELFVGSVVSEGTLTGEVCVFADSAVSLLTASGVSTSAVALRVEDDCRLVVTALGVEAPVDAGVEPDTNTVTRPKVDETAGAEGAHPASPGLGDLGINVGDPTGGVAGLAVDTAAGLAKTQTMEVGVRNWVRDAMRRTQYEDKVVARYIRNTRDKTVGKLVKVDGYCRGPLVGTLLAPVDSAQDRCYFRRLYNGPTRVVFISGGYYATRVGGVAVDERELYEAFEARYAGVYYKHCDTGPELPPRWTTGCTWDLPH